jgi:hypothetical protein
MPVLIHKGHRRMSIILKMTANDLWERRNLPCLSPDAKNQLAPRSSQSGAWTQGEGLAQKRMPLGKPGDMQTGPRLVKG